MRNSKLKQKMSEPIQEGPKNPKAIRELKMQYIQPKVPLTKLPLKKPGKISASDNIKNATIKNAINAAAKKGGIFKKKG